MRNPKVLQDPVLRKFCFNEFFDDVKKHVCKVHESSIKNLYFNKVVDNKIYELPDNKNLVVSREYYDIPELLFKSGEVVEDNASPRMTLCRFRLVVCRPKKRFHLTSAKTFSPILFCRVEPPIYQGWQIDFIKYSVSLKRTASQ